MMPYRNTENITMELLDEIDALHDALVITELNKGWSSDRKYLVITESEEKFLLRISSGDKYQVKKEEYEALIRAYNMTKHLSRPLEFGRTKSGRYVYSLLTYADGEDAVDVIKSLSKEEQYQLGYEAGQILKQIHSLPVPNEKILTPWGVRFSEKIDRKIKEYKECGVKIAGDDDFIRYINENRHLINDRPDVLQHGDYHIGNMILDGKTLTIIDFNRFDYGDPWEEFNRIVFCAKASPEFATGRIDGYFDGEVPEIFFRLMALYIVNNALSSIPWGNALGKSDLDTMIENWSFIYECYDGMKSFIPNWYER